MDTYKLPLVDEQTRALSAISPEDIRRVAARLFDERGVASVVVGNSELVKTQLEQMGKVEVMGEMEPKPDPKSETKPAANALRPPVKIPAKPE